MLEHGGAGRAGTIAEGPTAAMAVGGTPIPPPDEGVNFTVSYSQQLAQQYDCVMDLFINDKWHSTCKNRALIIHGKNSSRRLLAWSTTRSGLS